jgi:hypothetical protein
MKWGERHLMVSTQLVPRNVGRKITASPYAASAPPMRGPSITDTEMVAPTRLIYLHSVRRGGGRNTAHCNATHCHTVQRSTILHSRAQYHKAKHNNTHTTERLEVLRTVGAEWQAL